MRSVRVFHIGDMQNGFIRESGTLYVDGSSALIGRANEFISQINPDFFDYSLLILDTHFSEEYFQSEESVQFPIHCEYRTHDWELSIDVSGLSHKHYLPKNRFDMWGEQEDREIAFLTPERRFAYQHLFHVVDDPYQPVRSVPRDLFMQELCQGQSLQPLEVTMIGVAADYCIRYAMEGWLARGARVTILHDLIKGIGKEMVEVLGEEIYQHYGPEQLRSVSISEFLNEMNQS